MHDQFIQQTHTHESFVPNPKKDWIIFKTRIDVIRMPKTNYPQYPEGQLPLIQPSTT